MSQWTHVNGAIRFDALRMEGIPFNKIEDYEKLLGNTVSFKGPKSAWDKCNVPTGSEGSIQFSFWRNPDLHCVSAFGVHIFGDLRDFSQEDVPKIEEWFTQVITAKGVMVRSAILEIRVEYAEQVIILCAKEGKDGQSEVERITPNS